MMIHVNLSGLRSAQQSLDAEYDKLNAFWAALSSEMRGVHLPGSVSVEAGVHLGSASVDTEGLRLVFSRKGGSPTIWVEKGGSEWAIQSASLELRIAALSLVDQLIEAVGVAAVEVAAEIAAKVRVVKSEMGLED